MGLFKHIRTMYVQWPHKPEEDSRNCIYRWALANMHVLGKELRSSGLEFKHLNHQAISSALIVSILIILSKLEFCSHPAWTTVFHYCSLLLNFCFILFSVLMES